MARGPVTHNALQMTTRHMPVIGGNGAHTIRRRAYDTRNGVTTMAKFGPVQLAEVLNNCEQARQIREYNKQVLRSKDIWKRHPADYAFAIGKYYNEEQQASFAQPGSRQYKPSRKGDRKPSVDWRGMPVSGNAVPIFDHSAWKDTITGEWHTSHFYEDFAKSLEAGAERQRVIDMLKKCSDKEADLSGIDTRVVVERAGTLGSDGLPELIQIDAREIGPEDRQAYIRVEESHINDLANGYRNAMKIRYVWNDIESRPEFKGKVRIEWNYLDPQDTSRGLHPNGAAIVITAIAPMKDKDGNTVKDSEGNVVYVPLKNYEVFTWERFVAIDVDKAIAAGATWRTLCDSKWKKPDENRAGAGQGQTEETAKALSKIKTTQMPDVLTEAVRFFTEDSTTTAFKYGLLQMKQDERQDVYYNLVELHTALEKLITQEMMDAHKAVEKAETKRNADEVAARQRAALEQARMEIAPTQNQRNAAAEAQRLADNAAAEKEADTVHTPPSGAPGTGEQPGLEAKSVTAQSSTRSTGGNRKRSGAR